MLGRDRLRDGECGGLEEGDVEKLTCRVGCKWGCGVGIDTGDREVEVGKAGGGIVV